MWLITDKAQQERNREAFEKQWAESRKQEQEKREARESFIKANTCPHCGQCPPIPPWLM